MNKYLKKQEIEETKQNALDQYNQQINQNQINHIEESLTKGKSIDLTKLELFQVKKESTKKNIIVSMVNNFEVRYLAVINSSIYSFQLDSQMI